MKIQLAAWRSGVDVFGEGMQLHAALVEENRRFDNLAHRAGRAIQLPDNDNTAVAGTVEELHEFRPFGRRPKAIAGPKPSSPELFDQPFFLSAKRIDLPGRMDR